MQVYWLLSLAFVAPSVAAEALYHQDLALRMLTSILDRGQALASTSSGTSLIQLVSVRCGESRGIDGLSDDEIYS